MDSTKVACIYSELGDEQYYAYTLEGWKNAILCYNVAAILDFYNVTYFSKLALAYTSIARFYILNQSPAGKRYLERAKDILNIASSINSEHKDLLVAKSFWYYVSGDCDNSRKIFSKLDRNEMSSDFHYTLLRIKLDNIMSDRLIDLSRFNDAQNSLIYIWIVDNHIKLERYDEAIRLLKISAKYMPDNAFSYHYLGLCYFLKKHYNKSAESYSIAKELLPDFTKTYTNLGKVFTSMGNYKMAIKNLKKAINQNPYLYTAYNDLGVIYYKKKMYPHSIKAYKKAIEVNPYYHVAYNNLGIVFKEVEDYEESEYAYRKAIELCPTYSQAYNNLGTLLNRLNRHEESITCYKSALRINPKYENAYLNLERVYDLLESTY